MKIVVEIALGNDAMRTREHVRNTMERSLLRVGVAAFQDEDLIPGDGDDLFDANGNTVGSWKVTS